MTQTDILVIGAGPSGLFVSGELARHGIEVRLVEREVQRHRQARATAIQPGTLEILDYVDLLSPFLEAAEHVRCTRLYRTDLSEIDNATFEGIDCRCGFLCSLPQYETERILEAHFKSLGGAVERGVTVTKLALDGNGVLAELVHGEDAIETVQANVVIGAKRTKRKFTVTYIKLINRDIILLFEYCLKETKKKTNSTNSHLSNLVLNKNTNNMSILLIAINSKYETYMIITKQRKNFFVKPFKSSYFSSSFNNLDKK